MFYYVCTRMGMRRECGCRTRVVCTRMGMRRECACRTRVAHADWTGRYGVYVYMYICMYVCV